MDHGVMDQRGNRVVSRSSFDDLVMISFVLSLPCYPQTKISPDPRRETVVWILKVLRESMTLQEHSREQGLVSFIGGFQIF